MDGGVERGDTRKKTKKRKWEKITISRRPNQIITEEKKKKLKKTRRKGNETLPQREKIKI